MTFKWPILALFGLTSMVASSDFFSALDNYENKEYERSYHEFLSLAKIGEKRAQFNLGIMYFHGQHVEKNINKAYAWTKLATVNNESLKEERSVHNQIKEDVTDMTLADKEYQTLIDQYANHVLVKTLYPSLLNKTENSKPNAVPIKIKPPQYPRKLAMKSISGWVHVVFDLDKLGHPRNIRIIEGFPKNGFDRTALKSISQWKFEPMKDDDGKAINAYDITYTLDFRINNSETGLKKSYLANVRKEALKGDPQAQFTYGYIHKKLSSLKGKENPSEWFFKSALQGNPNAQYEIGASLLNGKGCKKNVNKALQWLTLAAENKQKEARELLAGFAAQSNTLESHQLAIRYLDDLDKLSASAKIRYSWLLATSPYETIANPKQAIELVDTLGKSEFSDKVTILEIKAAAEAALSNFDTATDLQEDALSKANSLEYDVSEIQERLSAYKNNAKWF